MIISAYQTLLKKRYECTECDYDSNLITHLWFHTLEVHTPKAFEGVKTKSVSNEEQALNLVAEQNNDIIIAISNLKAGISLALHDFDDRMQKSLNEIKEECRNNKKVMDEASKDISKLITNMERIESTSLEALKTIENKLDDLSQNVNSSSDTNPNPPPTEEPHPSEIPPSSSKLEMLVVADSIGKNANFRLLESRSQVLLRTATAYTALADSDARNPETNFKTVVKKEIKKRKFSYLVMGGGTNELSNLDTTAINADKFEDLEKKAVDSARNYFSIAEETLKENPSLRKIVLLNRISRFDLLHKDPLQIKHQLSNLANLEYSKLHTRSSLKDKIIIGKHNIDNSIFNRDQMYGIPGAGKYDGIHMFGRKGKIAFTNSLLDILKSAEIIKTSDNTTFHKSAGRNIPSQPAEIHQPAGSNSTHHFSENDHPDFTSQPSQNIHPSGRNNYSKPYENNPQHENVQTHHPAGRKVTGQPTVNIQPPGRTNSSKSSGNTYHNQHENVQTHQPAGRDSHSTCPQTLYQQSPQLKPEHQNNQPQYSRGSVNRNRYERQVGN